MHLSYSLGITAQQYDSEQWMRYIPNERANNKFCNPIKRMMMNDRMTGHERFMRTLFWIFSNAIFPSFFWNATSFHCRPLVKLRCSISLMMIIIQTKIYQGSDMRHHYSFNSNNYIDIIHLPE